MATSSALLENAKFNIGALFNITQFIISSGICLVFIRLMSKSRINREEFGFHLKSIFRVLGIATILGLVFYGISSIAENNMESLKKGGEEVAKSLKLGKNLTNDFLILLNVGLFAPVCEEIVFRGVIFQSFVKGLKKFPKISSNVALIIGLIVSAFAFTSSHGGGGQDEQMIFLAILSVFASLAFYFTKSMFAPIFAHAINNNVVFLVYVYQFVGFNSSHGISLLFGSIICLALSIPIGLLFGRILPKA